MTILIADTAANAVKKRVFSGCPLVEFDVKLTYN